jgi:hypothetical protein
MSGPDRDIEAVMPSKAQLGRLIEIRPGMKPFRGNRWGDEMMIEY